MQRTAIPLSKSKTLHLLSVSVAFLALGYWMFNLDASEIESLRRHNSPLLLHGIGLASMAGSGFGVLVAIRKLFDPSPGLILDDRGLTDNSSAFSAGFIPWSDIKGFEARKIQNSHALILYVLLSAPEKYVAKFNPLKRTLLSASLKVGPSPVAITSSTLAIGFDDLVSLLNEYLSAQRLGA